MFGRSTPAPFLIACSFCRPYATIGSPLKLERSTYWFCVASVGAVYGEAVCLQFVFLWQRVEWFELGQGLPAQAIKRVGMLQAIANVTVNHPQ